MIIDWEFTGVWGTPLLECGEVFMTVVEVMAALVIEFL
jgi:hypothetical protein